jgi:RimJ/RimL family protein N-acetyltransferase
MTPRLALRPVRFEDWPRVHEWASTAQACQYQPWGPNSPEETQAFVRTAAASWSQRPQTRYSWVAVDSNSQIVGAGELHRKDASQAMIGYIVHVRHWRLGVGTEIARLVTAYGFTELGLHRVAATCDPRNVGSAGILGNIGMTYEGRLREITRLRDGWRDSSVYSILQDEWRAANPSEGC